MGVKFVLGEEFNTMIGKLQATEQQVQTVAEQAIIESGNILYKGINEEITNDSELSREAKERLTRTLKDTRITQSNSSDVVGQVGFDFDNSQVIDDGRIAQFLNYGTVERKTNKGISRGKINGSQFLQRAIKRNAKAMRDKQKNVVETFLEQRGIV